MPFVFRILALELGENMMVPIGWNGSLSVLFYEAIGHKLEVEALLTINRRAVEKMILYAKKIMILLEKQHNNRLKSVMVFEETKRTAKLRRQHDSKNHSY